MWDRKIKLVKYNLPDSSSLMQEFQSAVNKACLSFVGLPISPEVKAKLATSVEQVLSSTLGDCGGVSKTRSLYELLPLRCKIGFHLLRTVRIPFLVHLFDALWFHGRHKRYDIGHAKSIMVMDFVLSPFIMPMFMNVRFEIAKEG